MCCIKSTYIWDTSKLQPLALLVFCIKFIYMKYQDLYVLYISAVRVLYMCYACAVHVLCMCCTCAVYVLCMCCTCAVHVLCMCCTCAVYVLCMCICLHVLCMCCTCVHDKLNIMEHDKLNDVSDIIYH